MKGLLDLFSRSPTPARVTMHVERLLAGWRDAYRAAGAEVFNLSAVLSATPTIEDAP